MSLFICALSLRFHFLPPGGGRNISIVYVITSGLKTKWVAPKTWQQSGCLQRTVGVRGGLFFYINNKVMILSKNWIGSHILKKEKLKHYQTELTDVTMASKTDQLLIVVSILEGKQFKGADYNLVRNTPTGNKVNYTTKNTLWVNSWCFTWYHKALTDFLNSSLLLLTMLASLDC